MRNTGWTTQLSTLQRLGWPGRWMHRAGSKTPAESYDRPSLANGGGPEPDTMPYGSQRVSTGAPEGRNSSRIQIWIRFYSLGFAFQYFVSINCIHFRILVFACGSGFWILSNLIRPLWEIAAYYLNPSVEPIVVTLSGLESPLQADLGRTIAVILDLINQSSSWGSKCPLPSGSQAATIWPDSNL